MYTQYVYYHNSTILLLQTAPAAAAMIVVQYTHHTVPVKRNFNTQRTYISKYQQMDEINDPNDNIIEILKYR